jgi:hypothetical protein
MRDKLSAAFLFVMVVVLSIATGCSNKSSLLLDPDDTDTTGGGPVVRKPNIYLYPKRTSIVSVELILPLGGTILESIPSYGGRWIVIVEPSGRINNRYEYLYYECQTPDRYQYDSGWIIQRDSLMTFFRANLKEAGFTGREIDDFLDYWIPRLVDHPYYSVYPQFLNDIEKVVKLTITEPPDNVLRLFYVIQGTDHRAGDMLVPTIPEFKREGFVVAEWGVVLK